MPDPCMYAKFFIVVGLFIMCVITIVLLFVLIFSVALRDDNDFMALLGFNFSRRP